MTTGVAAVKSVCVGCMLLEFAFVLIWLLLLYWLTVLILLAWLVLDFPSVLLLHLVTLLAMVLITPELNRLKCITVTKNKKQNTSWSNLIQFNVVLYLIHEVCLILTLMSYPKDFDAVQNTVEHDYLEKTLIFSFVSPSSWDDPWTLPVSHN